MYATIDIKRVSFRRMFSLGAAELIGRIIADQFLCKIYCDGEKFGVVSLDVHLRLDSVDTAHFRRDKRNAYRLR